MPTAKPMLPVKIIRELLNYDPDAGTFTWKERGMKYFETDVSRRIWNTRFAGKPALCTLAHNGYMYGAIFGENWSTHRIAWLFHTGKVPREVDHINGDRKDNRIVNLREVDRTANCRNMRIRRNTSGAVGISWHRKGQAWVARLGSKHIGLYKNFEEAVAARKAAELANDYHPNHGRMADIAIGG